MARGSTGAVAAVPGVARPRLGGTERRAVRRARHGRALLAGEVRKGKNIHVS